MPDSQLVDYSNEGFTIPIVRDDAMGYASVNKMFYGEEDGIEDSGNYFIYLLHPERGSTHFIIEPDNSYKGWNRLGGAPWVMDDLVQEIINEIEKRKMKNG
ncbi:MAG TPA: hypothetical protein VGQ04_03070 [Chitinophagaceae bacterium]|jgi:hypothetical protein|nr:hypothetical protein [Chitinophagaceae bacterium]